MLPHGSVGIFMAWETPKGVPEPWVQVGAQWCLCVTVAMLIPKGSCMVMWAPTRPERPREHPWVPIFPKRFREHSL